MQRNGPRASDGSDVATGRVTCNQLATHVILETRAWTLFGVLMVLMGAWVVRLGGVGEHHDEEPALALLLLCLLSIFFFFWLLLSAFFLLCSCFAWLFFFLAPALLAFWLNEKRHVKSCLMIS